MTDSTVDLNEPSESFGKHLTKTFLTSMASSTGLFGGMVLVGAMLTRSKSKKQADVETETETTNA